MKRLFIEFSVKVQKVLDEEEKEVVEDEKFEPLMIEFEEQLKNVLKSEMDLDNKEDIILIENYKFMKEETENVKEN